MSLITPSDFNVEYEQSVLGAILIDDEALDRVMDVFKPGHFHLLGHQVIAETVLRLHTDGKPHDAVMVAQSIPGGDPTTVELVWALAKGLGVASNVRFYALEVRELALRRAVKMVAHKVITTEPSEKGSDLLARVAGALAELEIRARAPTRQLGEVIIRRLEEIEREWKEQAAPRDLVPTGFEGLDAIVGGLKVGHLFVLAARPGVGKTAFISALADRVSARVPVGVFMLEDFGDALADRAIARRANIATPFLRDGRIWRQEHWDRTGAETFQGAIDLPIFVDDQHEQGIHEVCAGMRRWVREWRARGFVKAKDNGEPDGCQGVFVLDNLSEVDIENDTERLDREIGKVARRYRDALKQLHAAGVLVVHLNRGIEKREDPTPRLSDLKNSGDIEDAAHVIAMLSRDEKNTPDLMNLTIVKHRNGATGTVPLRWVKQYMAIEDLKPSGG